MCSHWVSHDAFVCRHLARNHAVLYRYEQLNRLLLRPCSTAHQCGVSFGCASVLSCFLSEPFLAYDIQFTAVNGVVARAQVTL